MKKMLLLFVALLLMPMAVDAACTKTGYVERVHVVSGQAAWSYIYVRPNALSTFVYRVLTKDARLVDAALSAATSRTHVLVKGSAAACPTTGNNRHIGVLQQLILAP